MNKIVPFLCFISFFTVAGGLPDLIYLNNFEEQIESKRVFISGHSLTDNPYANYFLLPI